MSPRLPFGLAGLVLACTGWTFPIQAAAQGPPAFVQGLAARGPASASRAGDLPALPGLRTVIHVRQRTSTSVDIVSSRDVSNVGVRYYDGTTQRFENLFGRQLTIAGTGPCAGKSIATVWVKSGPNFSGDGPGLGQRFELPSMSRPKPVRPVQGPY